MTRALPQHVISWHLGRPVTLSCCVLVRVIGPTAWQTVIFLRNVACSQLWVTSSTCSCAAQVDCNVSTLPAEVCELSKLQLLNLSQNAPLHQPEVGKLAEAPLHKVLHMLLPAPVVLAHGHVLHLC
jgi:hypothetical protein